MSLGHCWTALGSTLFEMRARQYGPDPSALRGWGRSTEFFCYGLDFDVSGRTTYGFGGQTIGFLTSTWFTTMRTSAAPVYTSEGVRIMSPDQL